MKYKVVISNPAKTDIINAIRWYKEHVPFKVKALKTEINKTAQSLNKFPERFQTHYKKHRFAPVQNFEYNLHYYIDNKELIIIITALFHEKEDPKNWGKKKPISKTH
jgi:plasmid stabilization system protein ParE